MTTIDLFSGTSPMTNTRSSNPPAIVLSEVLNDTRQESPLSLSSCEGLPEGFKRNGSSSDLGSIMGSPSSLSSSPTPVAAPMERILIRSIGLIQPTERICISAQIADVLALGWYRIIWRISLPPADQPLCSLLFRSTGENLNVTFRWSPETQRGSVKSCVNVEVGGFYIRDPNTLVHFPLQVQLETATKTRTTVCGYRVHCVKVVQKYRSPSRRSSLVLPKSLMVETMQTDKVTSLQMGVAARECFEESMLPSSMGPVLRQRYPTSTFRFTATPVFRLSPGRYQVLWKLHPGKKPITLHFSCIIYGEEVFHNVFWDAADQLWEQEQSTDPKEMSRRVTRLDSGYWFHFNAGTVDIVLPETGIKLAVHDNNSGTVCEGYAIDCVEIVR